MAIAIAQLNAFTQEKIMPKVIDNILNSNVLLYKLMGQKAKKWGGGTTFDTEVFYGTNTNAGAYAAASTLGIAVVEEFTRAQTDPVRYNVGIALEGLDMAINSGAQRVVNLAAQKVKSAEKALKDLMGTAIHSTTLANSILGLQTLCVHAASTYAGISSTDATGWHTSSGTEGRSGGSDNTTTTLTKAVLDTHYNSVKLDNDHPDIGITTDAIWSAIMTTYLMPNMRYTDTKMGNLGFENFKYRHAYFYGDDKCGATHLYFLNSEHLYFAIFPQMNFKFIPWDMAVNNDMHVAHIRWYGNLVCDEPRKQGWMSALTTVT